MENTQETYGQTAFPESEVYLRETLAEAPIDKHSFSTKMKRCVDCKGMCCYHGAHVNDEEASVIRQIVAQERDYFESIGLTLPEEVVVEGEWRGERSGLKTAVKTWHNRERVPDFPDHWDNTACVFLTDKGYCGLQMYSKDCGLHPWWAKPLICWLHPVNFPEEGGIRVYDKSNDPTVFEGYEGFNVHTRCGRCFEDGEPAYKVLENELAFLGNMVGRDFISEIKEEIDV